MREGKAMGKRKVIFGAIFVLACLMIASVGYGDWERQSIGGGSGARYLQDADDDGWVDSVSKTDWYKNPGDESGNWASYSIGNNDYTNLCGSMPKVGDVNGDGLADMVIGVGRNYSAPDRNRIYAFINPGTTGTWTRYLIGTLPDAPDGVETVAIGDMNNDGHPDILAGGECTLLRWYINPGTMQNNWSYYTVYDFSQDVEGMVIKDFNNDDYLDIAVTTCAPQGLSGGVYVLTNPQTESGNWTRTTLSTNRRSCVESIAAGDIDGDGWDDVVFSNSQPWTDSYLYWFENPQGGGSWTRRTIDTLSTEHLKGSPPEVADIDLDGKPDVICYRYDSSATYWYKNPGGGSNWAKTKIYNANIRYYGVGDADNDGDTDIINSGYWYINPKNSPQLGLWKLDEGEGTIAEDSSFAGNDGEVFYATWVDGKAGKALDFDGSNDYVGIDTFVYNQAGLIDKITVMAWIKTTDTNNAIIDFDRSEYWSLGVDFAGTVGSGKISWNTCGETEGIHNFGSATTVNDGNWRHIAVTYNSATGRKEIYIDGELDNSVDNAYSDGEKLGTGVTRYGFIGDGSEATTFNGTRNYRLFDGVIDEVRVSRRVLSAGEIKSQYKQFPGNWHFNEGEGTTAEDSSGCGNDGDLVNMDTATCWVDGKIGKALEFDGVNDYVNCGNDASLNITGNITIESWIKTTATGNRAIAGKYNAVKGYISAVVDGKAQTRIYSDPNSWTSLAGTTNVNDGEWHHIVSIWDSSDTANEMKIYVDGNLDGQKSWDYPPTSNSENLFIGDFCSTSGWPFNGSIDEVRIYSRALSEDEIYEHYLEGDTRGNWHFNEGEGTTAKDSSPCGNHGTLTNMDTDTCWVDGKIGKALEFDGDDDYVSAPAGMTSNLMTIEWWMNNPSSADEVIFMDRNLYNGSTGTEIWTAATLKLSVRGSGSTIVTSNENFVSVGWVHCTVTFSGTTATIYKNGALDNSGTIEQVAVSTHNFLTGIYGNESSAPFSGAIDEVRIYSRALTEDEIYEHYLEGDTKGKWKFDEGEGTTAKDSSPCDNDGTLTNMDPETCWVDGKIGKALEFDGVNDYVSAPAGMTSNPMTIEWWMNNPSSADEVIFMDRNLYNGSTGTEIWTAATLKLSVRGSGSTIVTSNENFVGVGWVHCAVTFSGTTATIYKNGALDNSGTIEQVVVSTHNFLTGIYGNESSAPFSGSIDEVRIYSRALSADEVWERYQEGL